MGNVRSISNALSLLGVNAEITSEREKISEADAIILPGVGAFSDGMKNLRDLGLIEVLQDEVIKKKKPYLGICLGLEFLAKESTEGGIHQGFGWINAKVEKIVPNNPELKVPHMGWDDTEVLHHIGLTRELEDPIFYYLHSYYLKVDNSEKGFITSVCDYGGVSIVATFQKDNIYAVQFHPEKSQSTGLKLLKNFLEEIRK